MGKLMSKPNSPCPTSHSPSILSPLSVLNTGQSSKLSKWFSSVRTSRSPQSSIFSYFSSSTPPPHWSSQPSIFSTLWRQNVSSTNDFISLFSDCVTTASSHTQEYLLFQDPEEKFAPSTEALTQVFLMTYISQSLQLQLTDRLNCTAMTCEQKILLGADWVWAVLEKHTKNPRIQIAVQVLHLPDRELAMKDCYPLVACSESMQIAQRESSHRTTCERMVDFCASIGKDCYALFLFFGKKNDRGNIYGVLSNNFNAANGKCSKIDRVFIENFFKGSRYLHTPMGMLQAIANQREGNHLTLLIKFT
ncbi:rab15 effector protein [Aplochiton taeniatus]